jgi:hypothetical protein
VVVVAVSAIVAVVVVVVAAAMVTMANTRYVGMTCHCIAVTTAVDMYISYIIIQMIIMMRMMNHETMWWCILEFPYCDNH